MAGSYAEAFWDLVHILAVAHPPSIHELSELWAEKHPNHNLEAVLRDIRKRVGLLMRNLDELEKV
jgi:hypothetical protein